MSDGNAVPCPMCGTENEHGAAFCTICGYSLQPASNAGGHKCARCGSNVPEGFDFCPVCGLDQRHRFARPATQIVRIDPDAGVLDSQQFPREHPPAQSMPPAVAQPGGPDPAHAHHQHAHHHHHHHHQPAPQQQAAPQQASPQQASPQQDVPQQAPPQGTVPHQAPPQHGYGQPGQPLQGNTPPHGHSPAAQPSPAQPAGTPPAQPAGTPPAQTGRTMFVDGPPLPRPPELGPPASPANPSADEDLKTVPAPGRERPRSDADPHAAAPPEPMFPAAGGTLRNEGGGGVADMPLPPDLDDFDTRVEPTGPRLVLVGRDGEEGQAFAFTGSAITIGRQHGEIVFGDDPFMSPQHARVERSGDVHTLVDLGSSNGVYLRTRGNASVYPGDLFMVGHQVLRLENVVEPVAEQGPAPDGTRSFGTPLKPAWGKLSLIGRGGVIGDTYYLRGAKVIFGREQGDILFPRDPFVSREHARLRLELHGAQMSVFLEDLESANGTYIRIRGSSEIRSTDTFRVGDQILRLRLDD